MRFNSLALQAAALAAAALLSTGARAGDFPLGMWVDHTGRGAVEIVDCNGKICGYIAWLDDPKNSEVCGDQVLGDVKSVGGGKWDQGWIWDPDTSSKYDVELTPQGDQLKVMGYAGTKWLSETYTWKRATTELKRCTKPGAASTTAPAPKAEAEPAPAPKKKKVAEVKTETPDTATDAVDAAPAPKKSAEAKKDDAKSTDTAAETASSEPKTKKAKKTDGPNAATMVARIVEAMNDDGNSEADRKPKTAKKKSCKMALPYLDMEVTYACDN